MWPSRRARFRSCHLSINLVIPLTMKKNLIAVEIQLIIGLLDVEVL